MSCPVCDPTGRLGISCVLGCRQSYSVPLGNFNMAQQNLGAQGQANMSNSLPALQFQASGQFQFNQDKELIVFLSLLEDNTDTQAVIAHFEILLNDEKICREEMEKVEAKYQASVQDKKDTFIKLCAKYRPSITPEFIERIKNLKTFY
jgi:hypothetical protein